MKPSKQGTVEGYIKPNMVGSTGLPSWLSQFPEYTLWLASRKAP